MCYNWALRPEKMGSEGQGQAHHEDNEPKQPMGVIEKDGGAVF